ncbi:holo-ACP synthase [Kribbella kalugense]|uniref:Holo-[acyl-carrier-protein] synthase n=1 Tax=Kribbella kalugense TaxID=2512221 RepID=A0A4R8A1T8_9ACTN|nr:holo-ACP synthase [Kribbella kalugense]TDW24155.1 holo-[acyl-carrier-protein] synthase [Kribbella kalugense]
MNDLGIRPGVDLVSVSDLAEMIATSGPVFMDMCWTQHEQTFCCGSVERLASRWAAKEATMKAIGRGIGDIDPLHIEVLSRDGYAPDLRLTGSAHACAEAAGLDTFVVSLSHEVDLAIAYVIGYAAAVVSPRPRARSGGCGWTPRRRPQARM